MEKSHNQWDASDRGSRSRFSTLAFSYMEGVSNGLSGHNCPTSRNLFFFAAVGAGNFKLSAQSRWFNFAWSLASGRLAHAFQNCDRYDIVECNFAYSFSLLDAS